MSIVPQNVRDKDFHFNINVHRLGDLAQTTLTKMSS